MRNKVKIFSVMDRIHCVFHDREVTREVIELRRSCTINNLDNERRYDIRLSHRKRVNHWLDELKRYVEGSRTVQRLDTSRMTLTASE